MAAFSVTTPLDNESAWHELALEIAGIGIWEWDFVAGKGQWSKGLCTLLAVKEDDCVLGPDGLLPFVHPEDQARYRQSIHHVIETGGEQNLEYRVLQPSGNVCWFLDRARVYVDEAGDPIRMIGAISDITDRKHAEFKRQELERQNSEQAAAEQALEAILDNASAVVYMKDLEGRLTMVNKAYLELFHVERSEVLGLRGLPIHSEEVLRQIREHDRLVLEGGVRQQFEEELIIRGETRTFLSVKFPMLDERGKPYALCGISADITARKSSEQLARQRGDELQEALGEINRFTYSVSHDMRSPVRGVIGNARFLREDLGEEIHPKVEERLVRIELAALKLGQLVDDLLAFTRLGRQEMRTDELDLTELAERQIAALAHTSEDARAAEYQIDPDIRVVGDSEFLSIALHALIDNACKYHKPGERARVQIRGMEGGFLVKDEGIGLNMAYAHKIFLPFERLHRDSDYPGTGIGLANVKRIVDRHGGELWVESEPGQGATFFIQLTRK